MFGNLNVKLRELIAYVLSLPKSFKTEKVGVGKDPAIDGVDLKAGKYLSITADNGVETDRTPKSYNEILRAKGPYSDFKISVQDGFGRAHFYWNVHNPNGNTHQFIKGGENAGWLKLYPYANEFSYKFADGSAAADGDPITWQDVFTALGGTHAKFGIGINPTHPLHVNGDIRIDGTTSTTANAGAATLPANPVGFLLVNIGGTAYKVPYYAV